MGLGARWRIRLRGRADSVAGLPRSWLVGTERGKSQVYDTQTFEFEQVVDGVMN